jgi:hypothetical protein
MAALNRPTIRQDTSSTNWKRSSNLHSVRNLYKPTGAFMKRNFDPKDGTSPDEELEPKPEDLETDDALDDDSDEEDPQDPW